MSEIRSQATPARDELAAYLDRVIDNEAWANTGAEAAKHIEEVLGWSKPRTVNSATELDALPHGTLIRDVVDRVGEIETAISGNRVVFWIGNECEDDLEDITLPVTVLFTPGEAG